RHPHEETAETPPWDSTRPRSHENFPRARQEPVNRVNGSTRTHELSPCAGGTLVPCVRSGAPGPRRKLPRRNHDEDGHVIEDVVTGTAGGTARGVEDPLRGEHASSRGDRVGGSPGTAG